MTESLRHFNWLLRSGRGPFGSLFALILLRNNLCINISDERFQVAVHLGNHGEAILANRLLLRLCVDFGDCAVNGGLSFADSLDVLLVLVHLGLLVLVALPGHLAQIGLALVLLLGAAHFWFAAADLSLLAGVITSQASLLNSLFDLTGCEKLPLLEDLIGSRLEFLAQRASVLRCGLLSVWLQVLLGDVVLHPVDVKRTGLGSVN